MDHYVSQQLPLNLRAFQISRLPFTVLRYYWKQPKAKVAAAGGLCIGAYVLWKIGSIRASYNEDHKTTPNNKKPGPAVDLVFFHRLSRLLRICVPRIYSWEFSQLVFLAILLLSRTFLTIFMAEIMGANASALLEGELFAFTNGLAKLGLVAIPASLVNSGMKYFTNVFALSCRKRLTQLAHEKYLSNSTFYRTLNYNQQRYIDHCDHRITQDIEKFSLAVSNIYTNTFKPLLDVVLFTRKLGSSVGLPGAFVMYAYYLLSGILLRSVMPSFAPLFHRQQKYEVDFRVSHSRLISHSEEIAFYGGDDFEKRVVNTRFERIFNESRRIFRLQSYVNVVDSWLVKYGATLMGYSIVAVPVFSRNRSSNQILSAVSAGADARDFICNTQLLVNLAPAIGQLVLLYKKIMSLSRYTSRVYELFEILDALNKPNRIKRFISPEQGRELLREFPTPEFIRGNTVCFEEVSIITPDSRLLIKNLSFEVKPGSNLLITGPNGCGKSSVFRVLCGVWPLHCGKITRPSNRDILYVPQRPYFPLGSLRDQVIYPFSHEQMLDAGHSDEELQTLLDTINLVYLLKRAGGWDAVENWDEVLSGGEKQRLTMARVFFHKPRYAILDECTSAVSTDVEGFLYQYAKEIGITLITVSHRDTLSKYHENLITFDERGNWTTSSLRQPNVRE